MKIITGSLNRTKINACESIFPEYKIKGQKTESKVSSQPMSDEETREGAINRAIASRPMDQNGLGIGLEGGVMVVNDVLYLCNWGALATSTGNIYTASGARIVLPECFQSQLKNGKELGEIMEHYAQREGVRTNEGAVGIFTNNIVDRSEMFTHVVKLLRGQWEYWSS